MFVSDTTQSKMRQRTLHTSAWRVVSNVRVLKRTYIRYGPAQAAQSYLPHLTQFRPLDEICHKQPHCTLFKPFNTASRIHGGLVAQGSLLWRST